MQRFNESALDNNLISLFHNSFLGTYPVSSILEVHDKNNITNDSFLPNEVTVPILQFDNGNDHLESSDFKIELVFNPNTNPDNSQPNDTPPFFIEVSGARRLFEGWQEKDFQIITKKKQLVQTTQFSCYVYNSFQRIKNRKCYQLLWFSILKSNCLWTPFLSFCVKAVDTKIK